MGMKKVTGAIVEKNLMRDSLQLMKISEELKKLSGVIEAVVAMGTETNKEIAKQLGLLLPEVEKAGDSDLFIAIAASDEASLKNAMSKAKELLSAPVSGGEMEYLDVESALSALPDANLAIVSVPGEYARDVTMKFLERGIHVHLFSDHVPEEHEVELKRYGYERGLLVLGPGAGTSIINGKAIAFANAVRRGPIGIIAAAGTGLQEVSSLIHNMGSGVSHGLGVGGGDVKNYVGGLMTKLSLSYMERDPSTKVIAIVSKPPQQETLNSILEFAEKNTTKPLVLGFMGKVDVKLSENLKRRTSVARTLHAAALEAVRLVSPSSYSEIVKKYTIPFEKIDEMLKPHYEKLNSSQKYIRALYTGGTLTSEALMIFDLLGLEIYSNAPLKGQKKLEDPFKSVENSVVDLGEEEFTAGRAHPMIDPTIRRLRLIEEAKDPGTAVILMDFVLGYGSHPDPAGAHIESIREAKKIAEREGRHLVIIGYVLGVEGDPQGFSEQKKKLEAEGVIVLPTNAISALAAATVALRGKLNREKVDVLYREYLKAYVEQGGGQ
ncbi:MAG: acyl-CoA synthetase FdrA [Fervidicoccaceae archaeon]